VMHPRNIHHTSVYVPQGTQYDSCREAKLLLLYGNNLAINFQHRTENITVGYVAFYHFVRLPKMRIRLCICFSFVNRGSVSDGRD
jgi:hypothetical protein